METTEMLPCPEPTCKREFTTVQGRARHSTSMHKLNGDGTPYMSPEDIIAARHAPPAPVAKKTKTKRRHQSQRVVMKHPTISDTEVMAGFMHIIDGKKIPMTPKNLAIMAEFADNNQKLLAKLTL